MIADAPAVIINAAVDHYRLYGYNINYPETVVVPDPTQEEVKLGFDYVAWTVPDYIAVTKGYESGMASLANVMAKPTSAQRARAFRACSFKCFDAAAIALHEVAHIVQFSYHKQLDWDDTPKVEGTAEAVAEDLYPGFIRRITGKAAPEYSLPRPPDDYWRYTVDVRKASALATSGPWWKPAAKAYRFRELGGVPQPVNIRIGTAVEYDPAKQ